MQLQLHEKATREVMEAMKLEVLEKLASMERSRASGKQNAVPNAFEPVCAPAGSPVPTEQKAREDVLTAKPPPCEHLNGAMFAAVGGHKINKGQSASSSKSNAEIPNDLSKYSIDYADDYTPRPGPQAALYACVKSRAFETASSSIILIYTVFIGVMSDLDMRDAIGKSEPPQWRWYVDLSFNCIFFVEVATRFLAECRHFFTGPERNWNIFDVLVALAGLLDVFSAFDVSLAVLRILRAFRVVRILRVIRIFRFFKELRLMVASILCCLVSLSWAFTLLIAVMYIFAVVLLQGASDYLQTQAEVEPGLRDILSEDFGSMLRTIFSLTQAVSGGRSWGEYAAPFVKISAWYGILFTFFVVFVIWGVLNILTGVFVESTATVANFDKELVIQEEMSRNESVINQIRALFSEIDVDKSGTITFAELRRNLRDERVKAYFGVLQMDVSEAAGLFQLLDRDESGEVSIEEFIMSCMRLKGAARSIDLVTMLFEHKRLYSMMRTFMGNVSSSLRELEATVALTAASCEHGRGGEIA